MLRKSDWVPGHFEHVRQEYDEDYARNYNQRFLLNERAILPTNHETELLRKILKPGDRWFDVACGTGYFLSQFPEIQRAGLDRSPSMLEIARQANPGVTFYERDFRLPEPAWENAWDVVSLMWWAYGLVATMDDVEACISNLAAWTAPRGTCFVPICTPEDLCGVQIPYENSTVFGGQLFITGVNWTWIDVHGVRHDNVAPHLEHLLGMFQEHFEEVEVVRYPEFQPAERNKAIIARRKRAR